MAESDHEKRPWMGFLFGMAIAALVIWLALGGGPSGESDLASREMRESGTRTSSVQGFAAPTPLYQISAGGRLKLAAMDLPDEGPLILGLDLSDEARGVGSRVVKVISPTRGRRDVVAIPVAGAESGVRVEIERDFLSHGLYMIEIDTVDHHPLRFRRYVLEIE